MNRLDVYYRALRAYRGVTAVRHCEELRDAVSQADRENDALTVSGNICTVQTDWMDAIEKGLTFVEKAVKEGRQFIHSNGEVVPIEKVKHVSRESVEHLARHSNLITKEKQVGDMIPDRLYSVEKQSEFAVYENRFLYMLLCYLRDFITVRYEKILELSNRYEGVLKVNKTVVFHGRRISWSVDLRDERRNDPFLRESNAARASIDRMDLLLRSVLSLLATPLMEIAGKAPLLKPPITKTNVLKMDNHFKGAMALYEYLAAYEGPGYTVERYTKSIAPFTDALADEISEACGMLAFLTYEHGLGLNDILKRRFDESENREREEQILRGERRLEQLKKKWEKGERTPEEYITELEDQLRLLQNDNRRLGPMKSRVEALEKQETLLQAQTEELREENRRLHDHIAEAEILHERDKEALRAEYGERMERNASRYESETSALRESYESRLSEMDEGRAASLLALENRHAAELEALEQKLRGEEARYESELAELRAKLDEALDERDRLSEENLVREARIKALRKLGGESFDENAFTDEADFNELERELEAFVKFYDERWGIAKKAIRKKLLHYEALKKKK